jgi:hypothetical protein
MYQTIYASLQLVLQLLVLDIDRYITKAKEFFKMFYGPDKSKAEVEALIRNYKGFDYVNELDAFKKNSRTQ